MSLGGLTSSNIDSIGDESENANEYKIANGWVVALSLTALVVVLVLLRFIINLMIDIVILRDTTAARNRFGFICCCRHRRCDPLVIVATPDIHSNIDANDDDDDYDNATSGSDEATPRLELSPSTIKSMETLLPVRIVTHEWMICQTNQLITTTATTTTHVAAVEAVSSATTSSHTPPPPQQQQQQQEELCSVIVNMDQEKDTESEHSPANQQHHNQPLLLHGDEEAGTSDMALSPTCSICLQEFLVGQSMVTVETCQHDFHSTCLQEWMIQPVVAAAADPHTTNVPSSRRNNSISWNNHCPNCRTPIVIPESKLDHVFSVAFSTPHR